MENSIEKDEEILNNIKAYMQENIDKGYHKFVYNDLGHDEKCVDVINAIEHILSDYKRVLKENEELLEVKVSASAHNRILELEKENEELKLYNNSITSQLEQMTTEKFKEGRIHQSEFKDFIPVRKVKDKIEEIDKIYNDIPEDEGNFAKAILIKEKQVLQELLEGRK